jgi:hypothetical protein
MSIKSFNHGTTYTVSDDNSVEKVPFAANSYIAPKLNYELGYKFKEQYSISIKPGVFLQTMHYKSAIPQATLELKLAYLIN